MTYVESEICQVLELAEVPGKDSSQLPLKGILLKPAHHLDLGAPGDLGLDFGFTPSPGELSPVLDRVGTDVPCLQPPHLHFQPNPIWTL